MVSSSLYGSVIPSHGSMGVVGMGQMLDVRILEGFSNLNGSLILRLDTVERG